MTLLGRGVHNTALSLYLQQEQHPSHHMDQDSRKARRCFLFCSVLSFMCMWKAQLDGLPYHRDSLEVETQGGQGPQLSVVQAQSTEW